MNRWTRQAEFGTVIESHQRLIRRVCRTFARTPPDREDLFQEVVYRLWRAYPSFGGRSKITTWIYRIAVNTAVTQIRRERRTPSGPSLQDLTPEPEAAGASAHVERTAILQHALEQLSPVDRALALLDLEDLSYLDMSEILGVSENAIGVRLNRIKERLAKLASRRVP